MRRLQLRGQRPKGRWSWNMVTVVASALDALSYEFSTVVALGQQLVVCSAEQTDVRRRSRTATTKRLLVMQFESAALFTALAVRADEAAPRTVAREHLAPYVVWDVTTASFRRRSSARRARGAALAEAPFDALGDEQVHCALDHYRQVAVRKLVSHQVLRLAELVVQLLARSELDLVPAGAEWA